MHEDLWAGVDLKAGYAAFFLDRTSTSLHPPARTQASVAQESTGAIVGNLWQQSFYPNLDAFLAMARSIPEIIQCCFGEDPVMARWLKGLDQAEKDRRTAFSVSFKPHYDPFRQHPLSNARNISFHRTGHPAVEVSITGRFGVVYIGSPVKSVPIAESGPRGDPGSDPPLPWRATQPAQPILPTWDQFTIDGKPLFDECRVYLQLALDLRDKARNICQQVHGSHSLTRPPG